MPTFYRRQQARPFRAKTYHPWWQRQLLAIVALIALVFFGRNINW